MHTPPTPTAVPEPTPVTDVLRAGALRSGDPRYGDAEVLALPVASAATGDPTGAAPVPGPGTAEGLSGYGLDLATVAAEERVTGRVGEVLRVPVRGGRALPARLLLVGMGAGSPTDLRRAAAALARACRGRTRLATTLGSGGTPEHTRATVEGLVLGGYLPPAAGLRRRDDSRPVAVAHLYGRHSVDAWRSGRVHAAASVRARDLAAMPSTVKHPSWLADQALRAAAGEGLTTEVWDRGRLEAEGFGGLLAVGAGSVHDPRMVRLDHRPDDAPSGRGPVVLVGKGITFDTGGLSIKPRDAMVPMRTDMTGAAVVIAALEACRRAGVRRHVIGLLPMAENAVGAASYRPADVIRHYDGRTTEVGNTDAEGRLVLADAIAYAVARLDPEVIVDVATLTGAASLGLGRRHAALYATDDDLAGGLLAAGRTSGELCWRMPLVEDYRQAVMSRVADLRQVPLDPKVGGGSITAALFLREFTDGRSWAHLDIAGPARSDKDEHEVTKGATGWGARLLLRWLEGLS